MPDSPRLRRQPRPSASRPPSAAPRLLLLLPLLARAYVPRSAPDPPLRRRRRPTSLNSLVAVAAGNYFRMSSGVETDEEDAPPPSRGNADDGISFGGVRLFPRGRPSTALEYVDGGTGEEAGLGRGLPLPPSGGRPPDDEEKEKEAEEKEAEAEAEAAPLSASIDVDGLLFGGLAGEEAASSSEDEDAPPASLLRNLSFSKVLQQGAGALSEEVDRALSDFSSAADEDAVSGWVKGMVRNLSDVLSDTLDEESLRQTLESSPLLDLLGRIGPSPATPAETVPETVREATVRAFLNAGTNTAELLRLADVVLSKGYLDDEGGGIFSDYDARLSQADDLDGPAVTSAVGLAAAVYAADATEKVHALGQSVVAKGTSGDIAWIVAEGVAPDEAPKMQRTIALKGFDASDQEVDLLRLAMRIATANPVPLRAENTEEEEDGWTTDGLDQLEVHEGVLEIAREIYADVIQHIDNANPDHDIVLTGHSMGGCLSVVLLLLMIEDRGVDFVRRRIRNVYTFGAPPVLRLASPSATSSPPLSRDAILDAVSLPPSLVRSYVQPWDPIVRLFTASDPLYPLVDDLGEDGITLYSSGPQRVLRPLTRTILENLDFWPSLRTVVVERCRQNYTNVGVQHVVLPSASRYLTDRLANLSLDVDPIETVVVLSAEELLPALERLFPLDEFSISLVPAALRSFIHHFYPAYSSIADFINMEERDNEEK